MRHFCSICGVLIRSCAAEDDMGPPVEDLEWYQLIRVFYKEWSEGIAEVTGVGYLNTLNQPVVPMIFNGFYWQPNVYINNSVPYSGASPHCCTYLAHEACWRVLLDRTLYGNLFTDFVAVALAQLFWGASLYRQYSFIRRHDYGGSNEFWDAEGDPIEIMSREGYGHCAVEPSGFVSVEDLLSCLGPEVPVEIPTTYPINSTLRLGNGLEKFTKFPTEVMHMFLTWLHSDDIQQLRLASRPVASISHPDQLPQFFWYGRFFPDFGMWFAMPIHTKGFYDWRSLYFRVKRGLKTHSSDRLVNRKRV